MVAHAEFALQPAQQQQHLDLHRGIERGGRFVGQQQARAAGQRHGDHRALAQAAGQLVRIVVQPPCGRRDLHQVQQFQRARACRGTAAALVAAHRLGDLLRRSYRRDRARSSAPGRSSTPGRRAARAARACRAPARPGRRCGSPPSIRARRAGSRRIMARRVTLLPEPDSPRMHSTSPGRTLKLTPFTACTVASRVTKRTVRSLDLDEQRSIAPALEWPESGFQHMAGGDMRSAFDATRPAPASVPRRPPRRTGSACGSGSRTADRSGWAGRR